MHNTVLIHRQWHRDLSSEAHTLFKCIVEHGFVRMCQIDAINSTDKTDKHAKSLYDFGTRTGIRHVVRRLSKKEISVIRSFISFLLVLITQISQLVVSFCNILILSATFYPYQKNFKKFNGLCTNYLEYIAHFAAGCRLRNMLLFGSTEILDREKLWALIVHYQ